jgi:hypothetical protein
VSAGLLPPTGGALGGDGSAFRLLTLVAAVILIAGLALIVWANRRADLKIRRDDD